MSKEEYKASLKEKIPYGCYFFGQGMVYTMVSQFLMMYYTDYAFLPTLAISVIMFGGKIWDGINDTLFGLIMDKVKFKSGKKFLPWIRISSIAIPISTVFLFSIEHVDHAGLRIGAAVLTYVLWDLCYTVSDAPIYALPTVMTPNVKDRGTFMTFAGIGGAVSMALSAIILPIIFEKSGFTAAGIVVAVLCFATMSLVNLTCRERFVVKVESQQEASLKETVQYLKGNHYLLIYYGYRLVTGVISVSMLTYMTKYCLGDMTAMSTIAVYSMPMILALYLLSPLIMKRFDKILIYRTCTILTVAVYLITWLIGYERKTLVLFLMAVIAALAILPGIVAGAIPQDCIEYGTFKTGVRKEGITFAVQSFLAKVASAFASANAALILYFLNYDAKAEVQPAGTVSAIWNCSLLIPMAGMALGLVLLFAYKLRDKDVQLMCDANEGKITKEEALEKMSRQYK